MATDSLPYGEDAVSWKTVRDKLYEPDYSGEVGHDDRGAKEMHRLRGLVVSQAAEIEFLLGLTTRALAPRSAPEETGLRDLAVNRKVRPATAGVLAQDLRRRLKQRRDYSRFREWLNSIDTAISKRNDCVHNSIAIGSAWVPYATGGGEFMAVISLLGTELVDEDDLRGHLLAQQRATAAVVHIAREVGAI